MKLSRRASWFLAAFGVWSVWIWVTFFKNLWADGEGLAFTDGDHSRPTAYFWIHATLALASLVLGVMVGTLGWRSLRAARAATDAVAPAPAPADPAGSTAGSTAVSAAVEPAGERVEAGSTPPA